MSQAEAFWEAKGICIYFNLKYYKYTNNEQSNITYTHNDYNL